MGNSSIVPPRTESQNPIINSTRAWTRRTGLLCTDCGQIGHMHRSCTAQPLLPWEQAILRTMLQETMYQTDYTGLAKPPLLVETNLVIAQKQQAKQ
jgi:hypothetical protein